MTIEEKVYNLILRMLKAEKEIQELKSIHKQQLLKLQEENNRRENIDEVSACNSGSFFCPPY